MAKGAFVHRHDMRLPSRGRKDLPLPPQVPTCRKCGGGMSLKDDVCPVKEKRNPNRPKKAPAII